MPLFPPGTPVTIVLDGRPLAAYVRAYLRRGRVFAPARPLLTRLADRLWFEDGVLVIERAASLVRVRVEGRPAGPLDGLYVSAGPVLRAIGMQVRYDPRGRRLLVRSAPATVALPTPFNASLPQTPAREVFTPEPIPTPRPVWTGTPLPRRTALPLTQPPGS